MINLLYSIIPSLCLFIGFYFGYKIGKDQELEIKTPIQIIEEKKVQKEIKNKENIMSQYLSNIDSYPYNQKEIKE